MGTAWVKTAHAGGEIVGGKFFKGGQFVTKDAIAIQAMMDGKAVPIISPGQRVNVPESWLQNVHRGERVS